MSLDANTHADISEENKCLLTASESGKIRFHKRLANSKYPKEFTEIKAHRGKITPSSTN